ncbi:MAG: alpha/beta hydrolase [Vicinamibacteria bacterium]
MPHITTKDNVKLYTKDWGAGRPVILIHGWPLTADTFDEMGMAIAEAGMRAIAYDRRGFGRSEQPWDGYNYDTLSDDLAAVLEYAKDDNATIIGFSMGGGEVARYMSRHAGRGLKQAVLIGSVVPFLLKTANNPDGVDGSAFEGMGKAIAADRAKFWSGFFNDFYGVGLVTQPVSEEVIEWTRSMAMQASVRATLECAKAFSSTDFRPDLASFKVPTLIIHGTDDKIVPIDISSRKAAAGIPGSTLIEYKGAPHGLFASHKEKLTADVLEFLKR